MRKLLDNCLELLKDKNREYELYFYQIQHENPRSEPSSSKTDFQFHFLKI